jgi:hypothetical protein
MKYGSLRCACLAASALLLVGCAGLPASGTAGAERPATLQASRVGNALVLDGEQIWQYNSDLLNIIVRGISGMQVRRGAACPEITMRGRKSVTTPSEPLVFVNGAQAGNTCLLEMMRSEDVQRVEVYPMGVSSRPGYPMNANGLILVFLRAAESELSGT